MVLIGRIYKVGALLLLLYLMGCSGQRAFYQAEELVQLGEYDQAVDLYFEAVAAKPKNREYAMKLHDARTKAAQNHALTARVLAAEGDFSSAKEEYQLALGFDPSFEIARQELSEVEANSRIADLLNEAEELYRARRLGPARDRADQVLQMIPNQPQAKAIIDKVRQGRSLVMDGFELDVASEQPITLKFKNTSIQDAFNILSKLSGINFIFDEEIKSEDMSVFLENATFPQALELMLRLNQLEKKVLNSKTIIVYPKTRDKEKQYRDQIIQTFYLSNIDAKKAVNLLRTMLQLRKVYVHEELNALVVRDTPDVIRLCQQMLEGADRADSEVTFDLELIEVNHADALSFGPKLSTYSFGGGLGKMTSTTSDSGVVTTAGKIVSSALSPGDLTTNLVEGLDGLQSFYTLPTATFDFLKTLTDAEVLANPRIRVKNKEKAKVHIGTREPVITVTINGDNRSDNVQYVDVGVKLNVEPNIQLDDSIVTKLNLEVSSVSGRQTTESGTVALTITTTTAETGLTLRDGERTIIGGLVRDDKSNSRQTLPILGDLPLIGNLFTSHSKNKSKREILLSITPHIVKNINLPTPLEATIWSGGEDDLKVGPTFGTFAESFVAETEKPRSTVAPALSQPVLPSLDHRNVAPAPDSSTEGESAPVSPEPLPQELFPLDEGPGNGDGAAVPQPPEVGANDFVLPPEETVLLPPLEIPPVGDGSLQLEGPTSVAVGEIFPLQVSIAAANRLYSAPLFVDFDPALFELIGAEEGDFLRQGDVPTVFTSSGNSNKGLIIVGLKQGVGGKGVSGEGVLFTLNLRAKAAGLGQIALDRINFRDPEGNRLELEADPLSVEVR
ncbi:MAG: hypothetical protein C0621_09880 [Desulfuromonas sp.]|nr:MAG: hypothetical protein C0621_09880 [Desulfuromonas sp.]